MSYTVLFNGTDVSTQKIIPCGTSDTWLSPPKSARSFARTPGRVRGYRSRFDELQGRPFAMPFRVESYSIADRRTATDWLKAFHRQDVTVNVDDGAGARELLTTITEIRLTPVSRFMTTVADGLVVADPADLVWRATSDTTLGSIGSSPVSVVLGTAPCEDWALAITVSGGSDPRTITVVLKTGAGITLATMTWTGALGANTLNISAATATTKVNTTDSTANHTGGYPVIDPKDSPTLTITSSSGTATGVLTHRKRYW